MNTQNNSEKDLKKLINKKIFEKICVITGKNSFNKSGISKIINFNDSKKKFKFYFKYSYLPEINELKKIIKFLDKFKPDLIIAVGGGAVLDLAKIANIAKIDDLNILEKNLSNYIVPGNKKNYPLVAIPTTAGSGAEVTSNAVIYINNVKYSVESNLLLPNYFFLISKLVLGNPKKLKATSGFDAIAQSIESLISVKSNKTSVYYAKKSLILSSKNFLKFVKNPSSINSEKMILAANLAGKAINISKTTAPHAVSYPFTSMYGISHGHAVSLTLEKFLNFNLLNKKFSKSNFELDKRYQIIFDVFNVKNIKELCKKIKYIKVNSGLEDNLKKLGINLDNGIDKFLEEVNLLRLKNNPVELTKKNLKDLLLKNE